MAIQLRRGNETDLDISRLQPGETAVCLDTGKIIVKLTGGNYLTLTDTSALRAIVDGKADSNHNHSGVYAPASHTHAQANIQQKDDLSISRNSPLPLYVQEDLLPHHQFAVRAVLQHIRYYLLPNSIGPRVSLLFMEVPGYSE